MLRVRPLQVVQPMHALMICTATMNGSVRNIDQVSAKPNWAPAWE